MFKRLTLLNGNPIYVNPAHIVTAKPTYRDGFDEEFKHTEVTFTNKSTIEVNELIEEIDARALGDYTPNNPLP